MSSRPHNQAPGAPTRATASLRRMRAQNAAPAAPSITRSRPQLRPPEPQSQIPNLSPDAVTYEDEGDADAETEHIGPAPSFSIRRTLFPGTSHGSSREPRRDASTGSLRRGQQTRSVGSSIAVTDAFTTPTASLNPGGGASMAHTYNSSTQPNGRSSDPEDDILIRDAKGNVNTAHSGADATNLLNASLLEDEDEEDEAGGDGVNAGVDMGVLERYRSRTGMSIDQTELKAALDVSLRDKLATLEQDKWMYEVVDLADDF